MTEMSTTNEDDTGVPVTVALPFDGVRLLRHARWNALEFDEPRPVLSSAAVGGGDGMAGRIVNLCVDGPDARAHCDDPQGCFDRLAAHHGWRGPVVGLMTGVCARKLGIALQRIGDAAWLVLATVGTSGAHRAGRAPVPAQGTGTINLVVCTQQDLTPAARAEALMLATEARCAALADRGIDSVNGQGPATGTGTDAIAIACTAGGGTPWTGYHTDSGHCLARAVTTAIGFSLDGGGISGIELPD
ncbi:MAG: adenosylcobinamide amidohydrolase [Halofilum sp. (in: g-proteobacteria)]|nr:adenosylcobinamide amidohydrolase [Halofilum sp. (in: g-proteobacteria)]